MSGKKANLEKLVSGVLSLFHSIEQIKEKEAGFLQEVIKEADSKELAALDVSLTECYIIELIKQNPALNTTGLARETGMTKGGISKLTGRMLEKKLLIITHPADNKKEINYAITVLGERFSEINKALLKREEKRLGKIFSDYGNKQICANIKLLEDLTGFLQRDKL